MSDRYRERWEKRQVKWERRRAKWEARAARHEARRARREARHAEWAARKARGRGTSDDMGMAMTGAFGGLFLLLGLVFAVLYPGVGRIASLVLCLFPGAAMLIPWIIWTRSRSRESTAADEQPAADPAQEAPQAVEVQIADPAAVSRVEHPPAPNAEPVRSPPAEPPSGARAANLDPSYYRERAAGYRRRIQSIIRNRRPGPLADVMASAVTNLQQWEERVGQLADRLTTFERDAIIQRDIKEAPVNIVRLRDQIEVESDAGIREHMARTLAGYESQQAMLDTLVRLMRRTRLLLDDTLVAMGTVYSQIHILDAMDIDDSKTTRIAQEIDEQVQRLNDLLSALGETYNGVNPPDDLAANARRIRLERNSAAGA